MKDLIRRMLGDLFASKKFRVAFAGALAWGLGKVGLNVDAEILAPIVGMAGLYVLSQGFADFGKEAAKQTKAGAIEAAKEGARRAAVATRDIAKEQLSKRMPDAVKEEIWIEVLSELDGAADRAIEFADSLAVPALPDNFTARDKSWFEARQKE